MKPTKEATALPGVWIVRPKVFGDERGFFKENFNQKEYAELELPTDFVQDNISWSRYGTVRGLHFQAPPHPQAKLVTVLYGEAVDVVLDIRRGSPTYGQHISVPLRAQEHTQLYVPEGMAHGFAVLSPYCLFCYKVRGKYDKPSEGGVRWNDPALGIDWKIGPEEAIISEKDKILPIFEELKTPFQYR